MKWAIFILLHETAKRGSHQSLHSLVEGSKDLHRRGDEVKITTMSQSSLSETEEAEAFSWDVAYREVCNREEAVQFARVSTINFYPRVLYPVV